MRQLHRTALTTIITVIFTLCLVGSAWAVLPSVSLTSKLAYQAIGKKTAGAVTITARLSKPSASAVTTTLVFTGAKSPAEDFGFGKNFTASDITLTRTYPDYETSRGSLTFAAGELSKSFTVTVFNNPVIDLDRTLRVSIESAVNARVSNIKTVSVKIIDDDRDYVLNVTNDSQLKGLDPSLAALPNDGTDCSPLLRDLLNWLTSNNKKAVLYFPEGIYKFHGSISGAAYYWPYGVTAIGDGQDKTILQRYNPTANDRVEPWDIVIRGAAYNSANDSLPLAFRKLSLSGRGKGGTLFELNPVGKTDFPTDRTMIVAPYSGGGQITVTFSVTQPTGDTTVHINNADRVQMAADLKAVLLANFPLLTAIDVSTTSFFACGGDGYGRSVHPYVRVSYGTGLLATEIDCDTNETAMLVSIPPGNVASAGKTVCRVEDCLVGNNPPSGGINFLAQSDGKSYKMNVPEVYMPYACYAYLGGYSKHEIVDLNAGARGYLHMEHCYTGFEGRADMDIKMDHVTASSCLIGHAGSDGYSPDSTTVITNSVITGFHWTGSLTGLPSSEDNIRIEDSVLTTDSGFLSVPGYMKFTRCDFYNKAGVDNYSAPFIAWGNVYGNTLNGQRVWFDHCNFYKAPDTTVAFGVAVASYPADADTRDCRVYMTDCNFVGPFTKCFGMDGSYGTKWYATNCTFNGTYVFSLASSTEATNWLVALDGGTYNTTKFFYMYNCPVDASNYLLMQNIVMDKAQNDVDTAGSEHTPNIHVGRIDGTDDVMRTILNGTGTTGQGMGFLGTDGSTAHDRLIWNGSNYKPNATHMDATWAGE